jgi:hypothetical protein
MKRRSMRSLRRQTQSALEGEAVALAHRRLAAEGDELEVISLRIEGLAGRS